MTCQLSVQAVMDIWETHALPGKIEKSADSIKFPLLATSSLTAGDQWKQLCDIDISLGDGSFIMASFVTFYDKETKHANRGSSPRPPKIQSRVKKSERRAIRISDQKSSKPFELAIFDRPFSDFWAWLFFE